MNETIISQYMVWRVILNVPKEGLFGATWKDRNSGAALAETFFDAMVRFTGAFFTTLVFLTVDFFAVAICILKNDSLGISRSMTTSDTKHKYNL